MLVDSRTEHPLSASRARACALVVLLAACSEVEVQGPAGSGGSGGAGGSGGEGGQWGCDGATCLAGEACGYEPGSGCDAKRVCAKKDRYPDCSAGWYVCSCEPVSQSVQVHCPDGLAPVPSPKEGVCPPP